MTTIAATTLPTTDGFELRAHIEPDHDITALHYSIYNDEQIAAFHRGDWSFVTLVVTASRAGVDLGTATLGAVELGAIPESERRTRFVDPLGDADGALAYYRSDLISDALDQADAALDRILQSSTTTTPGPLG